VKPLRLLGALLVATAGLLVFGANGDAKRPSPLTQPTITSTSGSISTTGSYAGDLMIKWTESAVPLGETSITYQIGGTAIATYVCVDTAGAAVSVSSCANPTTTQAGYPACSVTDGPGTLLDFTFVGLSGTKTTVSNTVDLDESYSSTLSSDCASTGGTLLLYEVEYDVITLQDTTNGSAAVYVGGGSGDFPATTMCSDARLSSCPSIS
jgi:hypothetical protein